MDKDEARRCLSIVACEYQQKTYEFWNAQIGQGAVVLNVKGESHTDYWVEIEAMWDGRPDGDIRVVLWAAMKRRASSER